MPTTAIGPSSRGRGLLVQTRFLRLRKAVALGDCINGWRVCWLGGWDKARVFFVVMVERMHRIAELGPRTMTLGFRSCGFIVGFLSCLLAVEVFRVRRRVRAPSF